jgi:hypothetical protein
MRQIVRISIQHPAGQAHRQEAAFACWIKQAGRQPASPPSQSAQCRKQAAARDTAMATAQADAVQPVQPN